MGDASLRNNRALEENTMAILDSSGLKHFRDIQDDRLAFLEAVRSSLSSDTPAAPSWKMRDAIFRILRDGDSLELALSSFRLLTELDKLYPKVYLASSDKPASSSGRVGEFLVVKEAWSPFTIGSEAAFGAGEEAGRNLDHLFDSVKFSSLIDEMAQAVSEMKFQLEIKAVERMLLFQYLVYVLEADFLPRYTLYKETQNWILFRESLLNILLGSRKINFKSLIRDCLSILYKKCHYQVEKSFQDLRSAKGSNAQLLHNGDVALVIAMSELEKETCIALQKLLTLIMELDAIRKEADLQGLTSRIDGFRIPMLEIILDELTYNPDHVFPFLVAFSEPKWKLEIIMEYFSKYCTKSSVRTRRSNESSNNATLEGILSYFSTPTNTKNIVKKITSEVTQLLLAHAFQACLSLLHDPKHITNSAERIGGTLSQICNGLISAFRNLRKIDEDLEITSFEKEALFTAATMLSQNS